MMKDTLTENGLKFFGTVSSSISHEIKNRMAVINEQAGLLKDLVNMSGQGREIDPERLMRLAESLKKQVVLTDGIIKNMNRFAHSVDSFQCSTDVGGVLALTAALIGRTADNKGVRIELQAEEPSFSIETAPFLLMNLVWQSLEAMMPYGDMDDPVVAGCEAAGSGGRVWFSVEKWPDPGGPSIPDGAKALADVLGAEVVLSPEEKKFGIELPSRMTNL